MNTGEPVDALDIRILDILQQEIPLVSRPWEAVAARLGIPEHLLLERMERLSRVGIIRGISPVIESGPLGINAATLVALPVPEERIREVAGIISRYPEVSHNFRRNHEYSLWFTLSAKDDKALEGILGEILDATDFSRDEALDLPTVRKIKIDVRFPVASAHSGGLHGSG